MEEEMPDATNVYVTCDTQGCENYAIAIFIAELYGDPWCGVCNQQITDIQDREPELPKDIPAWLL